MKPFSQPSDYGLGLRVVEVRLWLGFGVWGFRVYFRPWGFRVSGLSVRGSGLRVDIPNVCMDVLEGPVERPLLP